MNGGLAALVDRFEAAVADHAAAADRAVEAAVEAREARQRLDAARGELQAWAERLGSWEPVP